MTSVEQMAALRPGSMQPIKNDPAFDRLKASSRFRQLMPSGAGAQQ
jgi:hypothetical protein